MLTTTLLYLTLALDPPLPPEELPPIASIPVELEACILQAEVCVLTESSCGTETHIPGMAWQPCTSIYEDCAWFIDEMHEVSCQTSRITCHLEGLHSFSKEWAAYCFALDASCPSY